MSIHQYPKIDDKIYYWFSINDTTGTSIDAANVNVHVRCATNSFSAAPTVTLQPDLLTNTGFPDGSYQVLVQLDSANNFETGNTYGVFANAYVSASVNPLAALGSFTIDNPIHSNIKEINDNVEAAVNLANSALSITVGKASAASLTTTTMGSDVAEATNDHYVGKIITWTSGALYKQSSNVSAYTGSGGVFTFEAVTEAPSEGDSFVIT